MADSTVMPQVTAQLQVGLILRTNGVEINVSGSDPEAVVAKFDELRELYRGESGYVGGGGSGAAEASPKTIRDRIALRKRIEQARRGE